MTQHKNNIEGISLIEVLVALCILSIGALSIAAMQLFCLRNTHDAYLQSIAVVQMVSMIERLHVNHSRNAHERELKMWNDINKQRLPNGEGELRCIENHCTVTLYWKTHQEHQLIAETMVSS